MAIHFITGKPGGGKSLKAVKILADELRLSQREIVTNLPLKLENLAEYLQKEFGQTFRMNERIRILTQEETAEFWLHPARGVDLKDRVSMIFRGRSVSQVDYSPLEHVEGYCGTLFLLDEAHNFFGARQWQTTGEDAVHAMSQQRKLAWDVLVISQHTEMVEKQFRNLAQDFTVMRNLAKEKVGIFRGARLFLQQTYLTAPNSPNAKVTETGVFRLDVTGLANCYDTLAGVGIVGRSGGDTKQRQRGIPLSVAFIIIALLGGSLLIVPKGVGAAYGRYVTKAVNEKSPVPQKPKAAVPVVQSVTACCGNVPPAQDVQTAVPVSVAGYTKSMPAWDETNQVRVVGKIQLFGQWRVFLSDGRTFKQYEDSEFEMLTDRGAQIGGHWYPMKAPSLSGDGQPVAASTWSQAKPVIVSGAQSGPKVVRMQQ